MKYLVFLITFVTSVSYAQVYQPVTYNYNGTPVNGVKIKTNLPFTPGSHMPTIIIEGYNYGSSDAIGIMVNYYVYSTSGTAGDPATYYFAKYNATSYAGYTPVIKLANENNKVVIFIDSKDYFIRFMVRAFSKGLSEQSTWFDGWTVADEALTAPAVPAHQVTVPYRNRFKNEVILDGGLSIGTVVPTSNIAITRPLSPTNSISVNNSPIIKSGSNSITYFNTSAYTEADSFTVNNITHYGINQGTLGAGSKITNQYGFLVNSNFGSATNNMAFYGGVSSGTGKWNLYMAGSANNYFSGNLSIGNSTPPLYNLEITKPSDAIQRISTLATTNAVASIGFSTGNGSAVTANIANIGVLAGETKLRFMVGSNVSSSVTNFNTYTRMVLDNNGNLGIGSVNPVSKLQVSGAGGLALMTIQRTNYISTAHIGGIGFANGGNSYLTSITSAYGSDSTQASLSFRVGAPNTNAYALSEKMKIDKDGNVGIGTSSPTDKLVVQGNTVFRGDSTGAKFANDAYSGGRVYLALDGNAINGIGAGSDYLLIERYKNTQAAAITNSGSLSLVTTGANDITIKVNGNSTIFKSTGQIGIATTSIPTDYKLAVGGNIIAEKVKVKKQVGGLWPDYVFSADYKLPDLDDVENYTKKNSHLPEIPSAKEIEKDGQDLGEMNRLLLKKVEELTLYVIEQNKEIKEQNKNLIQQNNEIKVLKAKVEQLEKK